MEHKVPRRNESAMQALTIYYPNINYSMNSRKYLDVYTISNFQVEFSYPPLIPGTEGRNECPSGWKYLPTLALPDGSHNFSEDTVFFNLPSLLDPTDSIYGVSCYRQIPVEVGFNHKFIFYNYKTIFCRN